MRIYVSGPMSGLPEFNYPAFHDAKHRLEEAGYEVLSPADLGFRAGWEWVDYMEKDVEMVFAADGIATLAGWERSKGARIEHRIARGRGLPIETLDHWIRAA